MAWQQWNFEDHKVKKISVWSVGAEIIHQWTLSEHRTNPKNIKIYGWLKISNKHYHREQTNFTTNLNFWGNNLEMESSNTHEKS